MRTTNNPIGVFTTPAKKRGVLKGNTIYTIKMTNAAISKGDNDFVKSLSFIEYNIFYYIFLS
jgi:hypothetical protein